MNDEQNPFASPASEHQKRYVPSTDPSVDHEPDRLEEEFLLEKPDAVPLPGPSALDDEAVDHSVWDEPGLSANLAGHKPPDALTYERWLRQKIEATTWETSWRVTAFVACASGCLAVLGAFLIGTRSAFGFVNACVFSPLADEVVKIALATWIVEKRPFLFKSSLQIIVAGVVSGLGFAVIQNLVYLHLTPSPSVSLIVWRWGGCVVMHVGCSSCAATGLTRVWEDCIQHAHRPKLSKGAAYLVTAIAMHAMFNAVALIAF